MPTLPVPLPFLPAGGDLPIVDEDGIRRELPAQMQGDAAQAPVREALVSAQLAIFLAWQFASAWAAQQSDPTRAESLYLDGCGEDRSCFRQQGEIDETYQARMLAIPEIVTPEAILAAAGAILAPYSNVRPHLFEGTDRWFVNDGGSPGWHSFIGAPPSYPDRYYDDRPQSWPGGAWVFADDYGHYFVLRVPVIDNLDGSHLYPLDGTVGADQFGGDIAAAWIADGSDTGGSESSGAVASFVSVGFGTALDVYQAIVNSVEAIRGQGVRWMLYADPNLV